MKNCVVIYVCVNLINIKVGLLDVTVILERINESVKVHEKNVI